MELLCKTLSLIAVMVALVWLVQPPEECSFQLHLDRLVAFLGVLLIFVSTEIKYHDNSKVSESHNQGSKSHDVALLKDILTLLSPSEVDYFRKVDFNLNFSTLKSAVICCDEIHEFAHICRRADKEFVDTTVQKQHKKLISATQKLSQLILTKTHPIHKPFYICKDLTNPTERQDRKELQEAVNRFLQAYDDFLRISRKRITGKRGKMRI